MGHPVTGTTGTEIFEHILRMWFAMALPATFDGLVLIGVACDAEEGSMFSIFSAQHLIRLTMTV